MARPYGRNKDLLSRISQYDVSHEGHAVANRTDASKGSPACKAGIDIYSRATPDSSLGGFGFESQGLLLKIKFYTLRQIHGSGHDTLWRFAVVKKPETGGQGQDFREFDIELVVG